MGKYYLAYGSNLSIEQMRSRCRDHAIVGSTVLKDHRLAFKGMQNGSSYLTVEESEGSYVPVGVYQISDSDERMLDRFEGYPNSYQKEYIDVSLNGEVINAMIYVMNKKFDYHIPTEQYIEICKRGYKNFLFDQDILDEALEITKENMPKLYQKVI